MNRDHATFEHAAVPAATGTPKSLPASKIRPSGPHAKFVVLTPPTVLTTRATKPACRPASEQSPRPAARTSTMPQSSTGAWLAPADPTWPNSPFRDIPVLSAEEVKEWNEERYDEFLTMPGQLEKELGDWLVVAIDRTFRQQFRIFEKFDVVDRVLARFPSDMLERHRLDHACLYATFYLEWMRESFGKGRSRRHLVAYMRAMKNDPYGVAEKILLGDIVWPEPEPKRRRRKRN